jgi:hypothetical protein
MVPDGHSAPHEPAVQPANHRDANESATTAMVAEPEKTHVVRRFMAWHTIAHPRARLYPARGKR